MSVVAAAVVGSAVVGAYSANKSAKAQSRAADKATDAQTQANEQMIALQREMFQQQRKDLAPWREIGQQALTQLQSGIESGRFDPGSFEFHFEADPGYQFRMDQGIQALDRGAAARGRLQSGAQAQAITNYGQQLASQEYGNAFNRAMQQHGMEAGRRSDQFNQLATIAGVGQTASQQQQAAAQNMTNNISQGMMNTGNAIAQGAYAVGNAQAGAYQGMAQSANQGMQNWLTYKMLGS